MTATLENLLQDLTLDSAKRTTAPFESELNKTELTIFSPVSDHGYFSWTPGGSYRSLSNVKPQEIKDSIDVEAEPKKLVRLSSLQLPHRFPSLPPQEYENRFPFGNYGIAGLHVASKHRGLNLSTVDFVFGGSTLEMLAQQDVSKPYMVTKVPHTDGLIMVTKHHQYVQNLSVDGFQFERLVTGSNDRDVEFVEHQQLMKVGPHLVLFETESDALHNSAPAEIKASNPRYWGTKVMFQIISSGSPTLCHGIKYRGTLEKVELKTLSQVAATALVYPSNRKKLEKNILDGMSALKEGMRKYADGEVVQVSFSQGKLRLRPPTENVRILPSSDVVKQLLE